MVIEQYKCEGCGKVYEMWLDANSCEAKHRMEVDKLKQPN